MVKDRTYKFTVTFHDWDGVPADPDQVYVKIFNRYKQLLENINITGNKFSVGVYEYVRIFNEEGVFVVEFSDNIGTTVSNLRFTARVQFV